MNQTIRDYMSQASQRLSERMLNLPRDRHEWERTRPVRLARYLETFGLSDFMAQRRTAPPAHVTQRHQRPNYRVEHLYLQYLPELYMTASLYIPHLQRPLSDTRPTRPPPDLTAMPAIVYFSGHARNPRAHYQAHPKFLAELGFVVLILDTVMFGEVNGTHHGLYNRGWWHWTSRGYNPAAVEAAIGIRAIDYLSSRPEVDPQRIGATGISGGGGTSWWVAAADERVKAIAPICGTGTNASHVKDRAIDGHCDCLLFPNTLGWDFPDVYALVAPRPVFVGSALYDDVYAISGVRDAVAKLQSLYNILGFPNNLTLVETPTEHAYHARSRQGLFSFFLKHLQERDVAPEAVGDIDESEDALEPPEFFQVYESAPPADNRIDTIHDRWIKTATPPDISNPVEHEVEKKRVIQLLRETAFAHFPSDPAPLELQLDWEWAFGGPRRVQRYTFQSEPGWRLPIHVNWPRHYGTLGVPLQTHPKDPSSLATVDAQHINPHDPAELSPVPLLAVLRSPEEVRWHGEGFVGRFRGHPDHPWAHAFVETRGVGETSWGRDLQWHVRRALPLLGCTVASLRVYDTLRALSALRAMPNVDGRRLALAATGEMSVVALYAALLDGKVEAVILQNPPATQDAPGEPDGTGSAIEMLHCLRVTDVPQVAGLLWPTELVLVGDYPQSYEWAIDVFDGLGAPGHVSQVSHLSQWQPRAADEINGTEGPPYERREPAG